VHQRLLSIKTHLESGGVFICGSDSDTYLPRGRSVELDAIIRRLQARGDTLSTSDRAKLELYLTASERSELTAPVELIHGLVKEAH